MFVYSFEKLDVWNKARKLNTEVYKLTIDFPDTEKYGLTSQLRRAVVSISSNIAEGTSRLSYKEKGRFTSIAYGSLMEVLNQLILSTDLGCLKEDKYKRLRLLIEEVGNKLNSLRKRQLVKCK